jgi:SAM-dependent methyltransferase
VSGSRICLLGCLLGAALIYADAARSEGRERTFHSDHLDADVVVLPSVFFPNEAEVAVLPFMKENAARFAGKSVLEIGTGSGIISLYAAKLGATKVVSTDISEQAVRCATRNASRLGADEIIDVRLVPASDISAFSVIEPGERFDVLISNPPYALDLDATENTPLIDRGDLGLSIVRGLDAHLNPGGVAILLYNSLFYHYVMVKFASYEGWEVRKGAKSRPRLLRTLGSRDALQLLPGAPARGREDGCRRVPLRSARERGSQSDRGDQPARAALPGQHEKAPPRHHRDRAERDADRRGAGRRSLRSANGTLAAPITRRARTCSRLVPKKRALRESAPRTPRRPSDLPRGADAPS